jgi:FAD/FMN-containing dehydrogenase
MLLLRRGEEGYEAARLEAVWNARKPDRFPDAILLASDEADVVEAVALARREGWRIGIRSGGHSWIGTGVRDGGLLLDLSGLDSFTVDKEAQQVSAGPGLRGTDLNAALAADGLVFPSGHCPSVGIGGFLLGGGYGWNSRDLGPACLSVEALDVVLPSGQLVHANDATHPDLMWAARGAGPGFFGIVTRFYLRAYPLYERIVRSSYLFPAECRDDLLVWSYETLPTLPSKLEMSVKVSTTPGVEGQTASLTLAAFCSDGAGRPVRAFRRPDAGRPPVRGRRRLVRRAGGADSRGRPPGPRCPPHAAQLPAVDALGRVSGVGTGVLVHASAALLLAERGLGRPRRRPDQRELGPWRPRGAASDRPGHAVLRRQPGRPP